MINKYFLSPFQEIYKNWESFSGLLLFSATLIALFLANFIIWRFNTSRYGNMKIGFCNENLDLPNH